MDPKDEKKGGDASSPKQAFDRATSEFIAVTAHKIHTPVASIKWQVEMLLGGELGDLSEHQRESLQAVMDAAERLNDLSRALLYVFELEKDLPMMHLQETDLCMLLAKVERNISQVMKERNVHSVCEKCPPSLMATVDPELAFIVLRALLENAVLYSAAGSEVQLQLLQKEGMTEVAVRDQGCGIPQDLQHLVFTKFFRAPNGKRLYTEGTGLGLYVARTIADRMGTALSFESTEGKGSAFFWRIPARKIGRQPWEQKK